MEFVGSKYDGNYVNGRIFGKGRFQFPNGNVYVGEFKDGMFHGKGTIFFKGVGKYEGVWHNGISVDGEYTYSDGLMFKKEKEKEWNYCNDNDRRFYTEIKEGIQPPPFTQITNNNKVPSIPIGTYDTGEGYFNPKDGTIYTYQGSKKRKPEKDEIKWILQYCRKSM